MSLCKYGNSYSNTLKRMAGAQVNTAVDQQEAAKKEALLLFSFV
jgi:hypothetical protein